MSDSVPITFSLFIPDALFDELCKESFVLGYYHLTKNSILANCTSLIRRERDFKAILNNVWNFSCENRETLQFLGFMYSSEKPKDFQTDILKSYSPNIGFVLRINEVSRSFHFEHLFTPYSCNFNVQVIIYDGYSLANSQLLPLNKNVAVSESCDKTFVAFLIGTCHDFLRSAYNNACIKEVLNFIKVDTCKTLQLKTNFQLIILWIASFIYRLTSNLFKWCPEYLIKIVLLTALGQQFHQRYLHCEVLFDNLKERLPLSLKCKNLMCAILVDLLCGCLITYALLNTDIPEMMLNTAILKTNDIVNGLQDLINWLMGVPAGLKLNIPLNSALGKFFLYHIYLWESYMMVVQPVFAFIFKMCTIIGIFGLTFVFSLLNDLISLATIHIYCFYGYAARLYGYQITSLSALWRLFRGKKWNPLRQRIDSYTYNVHQLYLGTLIFTVLLFLLPTVMVYYFVFTCLRILVLIIQGVMSRLINILTICPLYCIISRILNSSETTGDVYFTVLNADDVLTLTMQASQVPLMTVIKLTLPEIKKFYEILTWKEFSSSIVWGKIVYPL